MTNGNTSRFETVAEEFYDSFVQAMRPDGTLFLKLDDQSPRIDDWRELVHAAHGDKAPNDYSYLMIHEVADLLQNASDYSRVYEEIPEALTDGGWARLLDWLQSMPATRSAYIDASMQGAGAENFYEVLRAAQNAEYREITDAVITGLLRLVEQEDL